MAFDRLSSILAVICVGAVPTLASADTMSRNFAICTQSKGTKQQIVAACSWLIDNAAKENELVGLFYGIRASTSDNKASNCRDARKVLVLVKDPKMTDAANKLIKLNC
ncbi:hypothetical protein [Pseudorhodoplanes sp.]|uniref:hypothetical protein n=1 Tax=Pseudorhodoplanes sp. TaxID=1934341 RepID=UPI003D0E006D